LDIQKELLKNLIRDKRLSQLKFTDNYEENRRRLLATVYTSDGNAFWVSVSKFYEKARNFSQGVIF
jgi:hypothetical protein